MLLEFRTKNYKFSVEEARFSMTAAPKSRGEAPLQVPKSNAILEADVSVLGAAVSDKKYERPANPALPLLGDAKTGVIIKFEMVVSVWGTKGSKGVKCDCGSRA